MTTFYSGLLLGLIVGGFLGILTAALCAAARAGDSFMSQGDDPDGLEN